MKPIGLTLIIASILPPLLLFSQFGGQADFGALLSQYLGIVSLIFMGLIQVMATRVKGIEVLFGPLDRVYVLHKWLAIFAIAAAFLHESIDAEAFSRFVTSNGTGDLAEDLGEIGYNGILVLGLGSLATFIPYKIWHWTHRLIGIFFALAASHFLLMPNVFSWSDPLGLYVSAFCFAGIFSFVYLTFKGFAGRTKTYTVKSVEVYGRITSVTLKPEGKPISHRAGQFAYVSFDQSGLGEVHPYTIASASRPDGMVRFCISALGSYTSRIHQLQVGTKASLSKGYGGFRPIVSHQDQIWIAGGVGITPFLAWAQTLTGQETGKVFLYYCVRNRVENPFKDELEALQKRLPNLHIQYFESDMGEYIDARLLKILQGTFFNKMPIAFCGPKAMRKKLLVDLKALNYPTRQFHYEEFQMRSGIGLRKLLMLLLEQVSFYSGKFGAAN
ncbi:3-ketosteroid-9-alpha-hydroxylase reductase subunit [Pseudovibrio axinellae]|uniref:3-ketosteroid-9-alpha-hydroxylase reductase subunit n=1 Tax=Pseudovibrio axinellae TaxID=989403 RepID=A0A165UND1_9HYPH|nr:ferredoxin reductase family protein [Pseudovibrio axinellae]KZL12601.1 3-ketosteroid-9-alpha-hydroxylase reductase subunit [Pseudovibrio axinellae]SEP64960.1 Predicted ferric reductase [Pseudovibrio axinellae]